MEPFISVARFFNCWFKMSFLLTYFYNLRKKMLLLLNTKSIMLMSFENHNWKFKKEKYFIYFSFRPIWLFFCHSNVRCDAIMKRKSQTGGLHPSCGVFVIRQNEGLFCHFIIAGDNLIGISNVCWNSNEELEVNIVV